MLRRVLLAFMLFLGLSAQAELESRTAKPKSVIRNSVVADYNSWFENIRVRGNGSPYETKALLYGTGFSYEYSLLRPDWGWGVQGGLIQGFAVAGDAADPTSYYAKRVPLTIFRGGGRYFMRVNPRFDLGVAGHLLLALKNYPEYLNMTVESPSSLMIGAFIDSRFRLDPSWELVQSMGTYSRGPSLAWRVGASYTFK